MNDNELDQSVRSLRDSGHSLKQIARALGVLPSVVRPLVRTIAAERDATSSEPELECLISPGWQKGLTVVGYSEWSDEALTGDGAPGLVSVLLARGEHHQKVSVCGYLLDVYCLGVKNALGPRRMPHEDLPSFSRSFFSGWGSTGLPIPIELARELVFGAAEYAQSLGFSTHPDFEQVRGHLGSWVGPSSIRFGCNGKPSFTQGPHDDPAAIMHTLEETIGAGNFDFIASLGTERSMNG